MASVVQDVRLHGFSTRAEFATAISWIDRHLQRLGLETISASSAFSRILAAPVLGMVDWPDSDRAARDGYAVRAFDTEAADFYAPLPFKLTDGVTWRPGDATLMAAGDALPMGADAVLPFEVTGRNDRGLTVMAPAAPGAGIRRRGSDIQKGQGVLAAGRRLRPADLRFLAELGVIAVDVICRPKVAVLVIGPKNGGVDILNPILLPMVARDGGLGLSVPAEPELSAAITQAASEADLVIVAGRTGSGADDEAIPAFRAAGGKLALHGIALQPGESTGLGHLGETPVILLPGEPAACMAAYEMLAARAVRGLSGMGEPIPALNVLLDRKIVSTVGTHEVVFVQMCEGRATALPAGGLAAMMADGYVVVPATSEGFAAGSFVPFQSYDAGPCVYG